MKRKTIWMVVSLLILTAVLVSACSGGSKKTPIKVGSKDFTEQFIIGEMYALVLEDAGFDVERKLNLGGTPVAQAAMESGEIDLYPEYTGTGLLTVLKLPVNSDREAVYQSVYDGYLEKYNFVWLNPSPMNNTQAIAMKRDKAEQMGIVTMSDMAAKASELVMVGPPEFQEREDGLPGIKAVYGDFTLKEYKSVDPGLRYQALVEDQADITVAFGTDGEISAYDLVLLQDDKNMFPPYQVAPVVRKEIIDAFPEVETVLNTLSALLTDGVMQELNYEVSGKQREPSEVAREFLVQAGLIK
ncbi:MAG: quaternary ammonium transporter [Anaerolineaceae bacterium]|nr:quaternary ammonium transporter [Anaerolineaceae bacterium]